MYTQCPNCDAQFELGIAELRAANGKLRCGQCNNIFNALLNLSEHEPAVPTLFQRSGVAAQATANEISPAKQPIDNVLPPVIRPLSNTDTVPKIEPAVQIRARGTASGLTQAGVISLGASHPNPDEHASHAMLSPTAQPVTDLSTLASAKTLAGNNECNGDDRLRWREAEGGQDEPTRPGKARNAGQEMNRLRRAQGIEEELPPLFLPDRRKSARPPGMFIESDDMYYDLLEPAEKERDQPGNGVGGWLAKLSWFVGAVLLLALLAAQYAYFMRADLAQYAMLRPVLEEACALVEPLINCGLPLRQDLSRISQREDQVKRHPIIEDALLATVTLVNEAGFAQAYPQLQLSLTGSDGASSATRRFLPEEYLDSGSDIKAGILPQASVQVILELAAPRPGFTPKSWSFTVY